VYQDRLHRRSRQGGHAHPQRSVRGEERGRSHN
jgi:hypothetical protein